MGFKYANARKAKEPQAVSAPILGRAKEMSQTDGGGYAFTLDQNKMLTRFLVLGATEGTYYLSKDKHQYKNTENIVNCIQADGVGVVREIVRVSTNNLAHKNDHAIYALALVFTYGNDEAKRLAAGEFSKVVRTGTHLFMFCEFIKAERGFGKLVRLAIQNWYNEKSDYGMALQVSKYQQREGWSHRDVFRLAHPRFGDGPKNTIAQWAMGKTIELDGSNDGESLLRGVEMTRLVGTDAAIVKLIKEYGLHREHIPTVYLNLPKVQEAMLPHMGGTALIRNLGNMTKSGLIKTFSPASKFIVNKLKDREWLKAQKLHPLSIFLAQKTYSSGQGVLGSGSWNPDQGIVEALETAFYDSFDLIEPTGKNIMFCLDVSGSMGMKYPGMPCSCAEVSAILAMAAIRSEPYVFVGGFASSFVDLKISKKDNLATATRKCLNNNFGSTNPGAAIEYAMKKGLDVDAFVVITDNEVNSGRHQTSYLNRFRTKMNKPNAKMIVCGLTASNFTIADPKDPNQLDIAGFSPDITSVLANFIGS